jgi:hypothetical protein
MSKTDNMRRVLALVDELRPFIKRGVSDDQLFEICERHLCKNSNHETTVKPDESERK